MPLNTSTIFSGLPPGMANTRPPERSKLAEAPTLGTDKAVNAPCPGGGGGGGGAWRRWNCRNMGANIEFNWH